MRIQGAPRDRRYVPLSRSDAATELAARRWSAALGCARERCLSSVYPKWSARNAPTKRLEPASPGAKLSRSPIPPVASAPVVRMTNRRSINGHVAQQRQFVQHLARTHHDRGQRIVGECDRQSGLLAQQDVKVPQQRASAGEHDSLVDDVRCEFRRCTLERDSYRLYDL